MKLRYATPLAIAASAGAENGHTRGVDRLLVLRSAHRFPAPGEAPGTEEVIGEGLDALRLLGAQPRYTFGTGTCRSTVDSRPLGRAARCTPSIPEFRTHLVRSPSSEFESRARWRSLRVSQG
jgi:hypothetical protein